MGALDKLNNKAIQKNTVVKEPIVKKDESLNEKPVKVEKEISAKKEKEIKPEVKEEKIPLAEPTVKIKDIEKSNSSDAPSLIGFNVKKKKATGRAQSIYMKDDISQKLKSLSKENGVSISELLNSILEAVLNDNSCTITLTAENIKKLDKYIKNGRSIDSVINEIIDKNLN